MLSNQVMAMLNVSFINRLAEVKDVLTILLVEIRKVAFVPNTLCCRFFHTLILRIQHGEESRGVNCSLCLLVER